MNCGTFEIQRIAAAIAEVMKTFEEKHCANCQLLLVKLVLLRNAKGEVSGYCCPGCNEKVCVVCGCSDYASCEGGCSWVVPGICSTHQRELDQALARTAQPRAHLSAVR